MAEMYTHSTAKDGKAAGSGETEEEGTKNLLKVEDKVEE